MRKLRLLPVAVPIYTAVGLVNLLPHVPRTPGRCEMACKDADDMRRRSGASGNTSDPPIPHMWTR